MTAISKNIHVPFLKRTKTVDITSLFFKRFECFAGNFFFFFVNCSQILWFVDSFSQTNRRWWHRFVLSLSLPFFFPFNNSAYPHFYCNFKPFTHHRISRMTTTLEVHGIFLCSIVCICCKTFLLSIRAQSLVARSFDFNILSFTDAQIQNNTTQINDATLCQCAIHYYLTIEHIRRNLLIRNIAKTET